MVSCGVEEHDTAMASDPVSFISVSLSQNHLWISQIHACNKINVCIKTEITNTTAL